MTLRQILLVALIIHIIICVLIYLCMMKGIFKASSGFMCIIFFVPVWGFAAYLICDRITRRSNDGRKAIQLEKLVLGDDYRRLSPGDISNDENIVPVSEALQLNDSATRRGLILEIMRADDKLNQINALRLAGVSDDIEVTHYAATTIMELMREYVIALQNLESAYNEDREREELLDAFISKLSEYINSGLLEDNMLLTERHRIAKLYAEKLRRSPESLATYLAAAKNALETEDYASAKEYIDLMKNKWQRDERVWLTTLNYYFDTGNTDAFFRTVSDIEAFGIYLSPGNKETVDFWREAMEKRVTS